MLIRAIWNFNLAASATAPSGSRRGSSRVTTSPTPCVLRAFLLTRWPLLAFANTPALPAIRPGGRPSSDRSEPGKLSAASDDHCGPYM
ncbi:hypothetical protein B0H17DRAFT_1055599 [Mycena rosella]|uniref:Uncharacterized protein n=1 Tax=Mycena rosella TaxID=1033263 RepID=A0AAD7DN75_MYCRO|nr:hypothetical protein B0H17DRAFT_1055599 [Mycena rosella]